MSHVMCHVSHVTCHMSSVTYIYIFFVVAQSSEAYRLRVCYQRGIQVTKEDISHKINVDEKSQIELLLKKKQPKYLLSRKVVTK